MVMFVLHQFGSRFIVQSISCTSIYFEIYPVTGASVVSSPAAAHSSSNTTLIAIIAAVVGAALCLALIIIVIIVVRYFNTIVSVRSSRCDVRVLWGVVCECLCCVCLFMCGHV